MQRVLSRVLRDPGSLLIWVIVAQFVFWGYQSLTHYPLLFGNYGYQVGIIWVISQIFSSLLFGLLVVLLVHKVLLQVSGVGGITLGSISMVLSGLVSGCGVCGIGLASVLGVGGLFAGLPLWGLEMQLLGVGLLAYANGLLLYRMDVCSG